MTSLPAHVTERVEVTRTFRCKVCSSRLILGDAAAYDHPDRAEQILADWLVRHRHGVPPTEKESPP